MIKQTLILIFLTSLFAGCASVPTNSNTTAANQLKQLHTPSEGKAGLYIYRSNSIVGSVLKKDIWLNEICVGESARGVFFHQEVDANKEHTIATESEFSPNLLILKAESGRNYYVQQFIKPGIIVGGAGLKLVNETIGLAAIQKLALAESGKCSKAYPKK